MQKTPLIKTEMTPFPYSIDAEALISQVFEMMEEHGIRHLPVTSDGTIFGMISERDARTANTLAERFQKQIAVRDVCSKNPFTVNLNTPLKNVANEMAEKRLGSVVVMKEDRIAGIFTTTDACRCLAGLIPGPDGPTTPQEAAKNDGIRHQQSK